MQWILALILGLVVLTLIAHKRRFVRVSESITIKASTGATYTEVNDLKNHATWSPWLITDPEATTSYAGDTTTPGGSYRWQGPIVGEGTLTLKNLTPGQSITSDLEFIKPWKSTAQVGYTFESAPDGHTRLTWWMESKLPLFLFFLAPMMKAWVGSDYQRGLLMLKDKVETGNVPSQVERKGHITTQQTEYVGIRSACTFDDVGPVMERDFSTLSTLNLPITGAPFAIYEEWNLMTKSGVVVSAFPVAPGTKADHPNVIHGTREAAQALHIQHTGAYRHLGNAWAMGYGTLKHEQKKPIQKTCFEVYTNDPADTPEDKLITDVYVTYA